MNIAISIIFFLLFFVCGILLFRLSKNSRFNPSLLLVLFGFIFAESSVLLGKYVNIVLFIQTSIMIAIGYFAFEIAAESRIRYFDHHMISILIFFVINASIMVFLFSLFSVSIFKIRFSWIAVLSLLIICFSLLHHKSHNLKLFKQVRLKKHLEVEAFICGPFVLAMTFILIEILAHTKDRGIEGIVDGIVSMGLGMGIGIFYSILYLKRLKKSKTIMLWAFVAFSFITAHFMGGSTLLAVLVFGLSYGHFFIPKRDLIKREIELYSELFSVLVFIILGYFLYFTVNVQLLLIALILFIVYISARHAALDIYYKTKLSFKEKMFLSIKTPLTAIPVLICFILYILIPVYHLFLQSIFIVVLYSLILDTIVSFIWTEDKTK